jgi:catechol 2,3-dioxygenase-like lactoylglutathione lyase family enzyme
MNSADSTHLDTIDHLALRVVDVPQALAWYQTTFDCEVIHQDDTWALLRFANIRVALVTAGQHPPHLAFERVDAECFGSLQTHRDGIRSTYIQDPSGNSVEILAADNINRAHLTRKRKTKLKGSQCLD